jgi:hypothetical protein
VVFENNAGFPASTDTAISYWTDMGEPELAVLADGGRQVIDDTPWEAAYLPGKCALTPDMEILGCYTGHGNSEPMAAIVDHHTASN